MLGIRIIALAVCCGLFAAFSSTVFNGLVFDVEVTVATTYLAVSSVGGSGDVSEGYSTAWSALQSEWDVPAWMNELAVAWSELVAWVRTRVAEGYRQASALVLGLAIALALPLLAIIGLLARYRPRRNRQARPTGWPSRLVPPSPWQRVGRLEVITGQDDVAFDIVHELVRIGRADDNDIRLAHNTIHRYHAVVERSPEMLFTIVDVSGDDGNGIRMRGESVTQARLSDGDVFEVGNVTLRFHLAEV